MRKPRPWLVRILALSAFAVSSLTLFALKLRRSSVKKEK